MSTPLSASTRRVGRASAVGVAALAACLALVAVCAQPDVDTALLQPGSGEALVWTRQAMKQMAISKLRQEHRELEGKLKEVRERLENRRLERKVVGLQRDIQALRQRAARAGAVGASAGASDSGRRPQMLRVEYKGPWSKSLAQSSFTDDDNPLYNASPADKVMDPEERPFLRGPGPHRGDLAHPETGDYASVNTYANLVDNKENMDWCSENFDFVHDRIKCMKKLNPAGPALA